MKKINFDTIYKWSIKLLLVSVFILVIVTQKSYAGIVIVPDITVSEKLVLTPGRNVLYGTNGCWFNWGGLKRYDIQGLFDGASSYRVDFRTTSTGRNCLSIKTDVTDNKVQIPYVNYNNFRPKITRTLVTFASTQATGTIFTISENLYEIGITNVEAGTYGTPEYFVCEVATNGLTLKWLKMAGLDNRLPNGFVFSMTFTPSSHRCANISMTFDPKLLKQPNVPVIPEPVQCPINCIP
jgi:hypothetical protein